MNDMLTTYIRSAVRRVRLARDCDRRGQHGTAAQHLKVAADMLQGAARESEFREAHENVRADREPRYSSDRDLRTLDSEVTGS